MPRNRAMRALAVAFFLTALPAFGAPTEADVLRAKQHYKIGRGHYQAGRYADAIRAFELANAIKPHGVFLYDMAQAYRLSGDQIGRAHV